MKKTFLIATLVMFGLASVACTNKTVEENPEETEELVNDPIDETEENEMMPEELPESESPMDEKIESDKKVIEIKKEIKETY